MEMVRGLMRKLIASHYLSPKMAQQLCHLNIHVYGIVSRSHTPTMWRPIGNTGIGDMKTQTMGKLHKTASSFQLLMHLFCNFVHTLKVKEREESENIDSDFVGVISKGGMLLFSLLKVGKNLSILLVHNLLAK